MLLLQTCAVTLCVWIMLFLQSGRWRKLKQHLYFILVLPQNNNSAIKSSFSNVMTSTLNSSRYPLANPRFAVLSGLCSIPRTVFTCYIVVYILKGHSFKLILSVYIVSRFLIQNDIYMCYLFWPNHLTKPHSRWFKEKMYFIFVTTRKKRNFIYQNAVGFIIQAKIDGKWAVSNQMVKWNSGET